MLLSHTETHQDVHKEDSQGTRVSPGMCIVPAGGMRAGGVHPQCWDVQCSLCMVHVVFGAWEMMVSCRCFRCGVAVSQVLFCHILCYTGVCPGTLAPLQSPLLSCHSCR